MLAKFKQFSEEILAEAGRNYKISVLEKYKDDADIKYLLNFIYNPYIVTGLSEKKLNKELFVLNSLFIEYTTYNNLRDLLEYLKVHNTGRDDDIATVQETRNAHFANDAELFDRIVTKNVQLGIDAKTINKVIPGLIPEFNVQLSNKYFDKPEVVEGKEFVITTKIDGSRIIAMKDNGQVSFWTRQGQKYEGLVDLEAALKSISEDNFAFDGEIVAMDTDKEDTYKNTMKLSRTKETVKHGLKMLVFDYMPIADFKIQRCQMTYSTRRSTLSAIFDHNSQHLAPYFELLPMLYKGYDTSKIIEFLNEQTAKGEEGIMINICDAPYDFKRTNNLLKCKKFLDTEVKIIDYEEGANKLAGTLGAFVCEYKNNIVKVGSGLSDEDRAYFWANKEKYLNKYITVKYFEESYDSKTNLPSLRFPIYMRVREDI